MNVSPIPITRIHKDHPKNQIIRDINLATQTRRMTKISKEHAMIKLIEAMPDECAIQFRLPKMDVKSAFLYGNIEEDVYVCQPPAFEDQQFLTQSYNSMGLQRIFNVLDLKQMMHKRFQMSSMGEIIFFLGLQVRINKKSQENSQNQASTDTRIRRVQKEAKGSKPILEEARGASGVKSIHKRANTKDRDKSVLSKDFLALPIKKATSNTGESTMECAFLCENSSTKRTQTSLNGIHAGKSSGVPVDKRPTINMDEFE
ncbi:hypothetical protein Tco_1344876 [Tanacetum coccineum]